MPTFAFNGTLGRKTQVMARAVADASAVCARDPDDFPTQLGLPSEFGYLVARALEWSLNVHDSGVGAAWAIAMLSAIPEGADVQPALYRIRARVLREVTLTMLPEGKAWGARAAVEESARLCVLDAAGAPPSEAENLRCIEAAEEAALAAGAAAAMRGAYSLTVQGHASWREAASKTAEANAAARAAQAARAARTVGAGMASASGSATAWAKVVAIAIEELASQPGAQDGLPPRHLDPPQGT